MRAKQSDTAQETDWKAIALQLAKRVNFAIGHCSCTGSMMDMKTGKVTGWLDYMADALEMLPDIKVDREMLGTMYMPSAKRKKAQAEILKRRAGAAAS